MNAGYLIIDVHGEWNLGIFCLIDQLKRFAPNPVSKLKTFHMANFSIAFEKHQVTLVEKIDGHNSCRTFHWHADKGSLHVVEKQ